MKRVISFLAGLFLTVNVAQAGLNPVFWQMCAGETAVVSNDCTTTTSTSEYDAEIDNNASTLLSNSHPYVNVTGTNIDVFYAEGVIGGASRVLRWAHSTNTGSTWSVSTIRDYTNDKFQYILGVDVDDSGYYHVVYNTQNLSPNKIRYITNKSGSLVETEIYSTTSAITERGAVVWDSNTSDVFAMFATGASYSPVLKWWDNSGSSWTTSNLTGASTISAFAPWLDIRNDGDLFIGAAGTSTTYYWDTYDPDTDAIVDGGTFTGPATFAYNVLWNKRLGDNDIIDVFYFLSGDLYIITNATGSFATTKLLDTANTYSTPQTTYTYNQPKRMYQYYEGRYRMVVYDSTTGPPSGYFMWDSYYPTDTSNTITRTADASGSYLWNIEGPNCNLSHYIYRDSFSNISYSFETLN